MYVKATERIISTAKSKIEAMYKKPLEDAQNWFNYGLNKEEFEARLENEIFSPDVVDAIRVLASRFTVGQVYTQLTVYIHDSPSSVTPYPLQLSRERRGPEVWMGYESRKYPKVKNPEIVEIAVKRKQKIDFIKGEMMEFQNKVTNAMRVAPSLNQLVKTWPAVLDLLDAETIQRLNTKAEKAERKKTDEVLKTSTEDLSVYMLKAKIKA